MMSPCTSFTKIWRMRNNGTLVWARGTQLLWIDGDRFSPTVRVELEVVTVLCYVCFFFIIFFLGLDKLYF